MMFGYGKLRRERDSLRHDLGALCRELDKEVRLHNEAASEAETLRQQLAMEREKNAIRASLGKYIDERMSEYRATLRDIIAMETPNCAHIGKRMAARARQALTSDPAVPLKAAKPPVELSPAA